MLLFVPWFLCAVSARAQESGEKDHAVVLELGGAGEWPTRGGATNLGGTVAAEYTPIEHWLELEAGLTALGSTGHTELSGDLVFKKPWRLSPTAEFMIGAGPSWGRTLSGPDRGTQLSAEFALDFMFWTHGKLGWYVEPSWSVAPRTWERTIGVNGGLLIGLP
jgi:hypothetical protein